MRRKLMILWALTGAFAATAVCDTRSSEPTPTAEVASNPTQPPSSEPTQPPVEEDIDALTTPTTVLTPTAVIVASLTGAELYTEALALTQAWQADAVLSRMDSGAIHPLDAEGKGEGWEAQFWSPGAGAM